MMNRAHVNKYEPIVQQVELVEEFPYCGHIKLPDGREKPVPIRHLVPKRDTAIHSHNMEHIDESQ